MMVSYWVMVTCLIVMFILYWVERRERLKMQRSIINVIKKAELSIGAESAKSNADKRKS